MEAKSGASADVLATLLRLDDERVGAMNSGDVEACARLMADDLLHIHAIGVVETKDEFLQKNVASAKRPIRSRGERKVRLYGDYAIMTGVQHIKSTERSADLMVTQVWRLEDEQWKQSSFHACRVAEPKA